MRVVPRDGSPPAFGKTVAAANLIARRKVSTLVLVEKVTLLEQWKERLEQFLDIDEELPELLTPTGRKSRKKRSIIGQIGGGKRLPSASSISRSSRRCSRRATFPTRSG